MKFIIFDAGPLISLTMNGLLHVLEDLKKEFNGEFVITPQVKNEVVNRPLKIKKYKLEAIKVKDLIDRKILRLSTDFVSTQKLDQELSRMLRKTNGVLQISQTGEKIQIVHEGEASCLAFSNLCNTENVIVIDERSTRMITEYPQGLKKMMEKKLHAKLSLNEKELPEFKKYKFIRSPELIYMAYKKDVLQIKKSKELLDAMLYGLKYKGAAISSSEIEELKRLA